jgi:hypothetical protein
MIKNRKLTLEQRVARLENALKANRTSHRKFEDRPVNDNLLALAKELKARLRMKNVEPTNVKCYDGEIVVTLDWDYFGIVNFYVFPTAKGFHVESDEDDNEDFETLDRVVKYIADRDYEAAMDL